MPNDPAEFRHLESVKSLITRNLAVLRESLPLLKTQLSSAQEYMWDHAPHLVRDFDDAVQLAVEGQSLDRAQAAYNQALREIERQSRQLMSPYFARLDYTASGREHTIYIGPYSLRQENGRGLMIVDWRAPAASMFYSCDLGPGWFQAPSGRRETTITLKRQFQIRNGRLELMYDSDSAMFDSILGQALSGNTQHSLRVIIGSIQREQNAAIREEPGKSCLIYGLAGSGKTSVGLHRLAYILYACRDTIRARDIVIVSSSAVFGAYISSILPELGEEPAGQLIFPDLLEQSLSGEYMVEDPGRQLLAVERGEQPRCRGIGLKYSLDFLEYCAAQLARYPYALPDITYRGQQVIGGQALSGRMEEMSSRSFKAGQELLERLIKDAVTLHFREREAELLEAIEREGDGRVSGAEAKLILRRERSQLINDSISEIARLNGLSPRLQTSRLLRGYLESLGQDTAPADLLEEALAGNGLYLEDALLYLYIRLLMGAQPSRPEIKHLLIDEAQDYSPLHLSVLRRMFPKAKLTLLADVCQAVTPLCCTEDYPSFSRIFGELREIRLDRCYRSSSEINALAFRLLGEDAEGYSYFQRSVKEPQVVVGDPADTLPGILAGLGKYDSIGVLTPDGETARMAAAAAPEAQLILSPESRLEGRVAVMPLLLSKGLEFDAAIVVGAKEMLEMPNGRKRVYLAVTRGLHEAFFLEKEMGALQG